MRVWRVGVGVGGESHDGYEFFGEAHGEMRTE
jgi:hypothetical protein